MSDYRLLVTARSFAKYDAEPVERLRANSIETVTSATPGPLNEEGLLKAVDAAGRIDALMVGNDDVTCRVIGALSGVKVISRYGVGTDNIDIPAATAKGIVVTNTPGANDKSVADLAMGLVIACARSIPQHVNSVQAGSWGRKVGMELDGKTLGIIGLGRIGKGLAVRAAAFGMKVIAFDKYWDEAFAAANGVARADIDTILRVSDFVSLHVPATAETENMINAVSIATMKDGACIINTARGELIDEQALADAVKSGKLKAAAVDVTRHEPPTGSPLLGIENLLITPHIGANTAEAGKLMSSIAADNVIAVLTGSPCPNRVN
jgi:D-3-phosphoglycerate dehydrogenase